MKAVNRWIARILVLCMLGAGMPLPAFAGVVTTDEISAGVQHERIKGFLERAEVRAQLESMGVDANAARDRVAALTDEEARQLADRIDQLPAGGNVLGVLFAVFVILLVTDILGFTKIFPFTRSMR